MGGSLLGLLRPIGGASVVSLFDALIYQPGFISLDNTRGVLCKPEQRSRFGYRIYRSLFWSWRSRVTSVSEPYQRVASVPC